MNQEYWKKTGIGMAIAAAGAALTYLLAILNIIDTQVETPATVAFLSALVNLARNWLRSYSEKKGLSANDNKQPE